MMADLLQSAVLDIWHPAQQAGIDVRLNANAPEVMRHGQPLLLSLLARNLLDNAVRYSPRGSVVDVTLNTQSFTVRDNGPGISTDALTRLGERFYRPPGRGRHRQRSGVVYRQAYRGVARDARLAGQCAGRGLCSDRQLVRLLR